MAEQHPGTDTSSPPDRGSPPRMPRWVKWPGIILGILVLLLVLLRLAGVEHGPGLHTPGDRSTEQQGHMPGGGGH